VAKFKEGDRVRVQTPNFSAGDALSDVYEHMQGLVGVVANVYNDDEIAIQVDLESLSAVQKDVHKVGTRRMHAKLDENLSQEGARLLTKEEIQFTPNYVILARAKDLVPA
jgi:ribosomal protein L21E